MTETLCPTLFDRRVLPLAELFALCLDGQLFRVGDSFAATGTPDTPELRAHALAATVPHRAIAERATAAWIHGTRGRPPARPQICFIPAHRSTAVGQGVDARQRALEPAETVAVGPIAATTPLRTAADLLLHTAEFGPAEALEVRHLLSLGEQAPEALRLFVPKTRRGGSVRATERIAAVERVRLPLVEGGERVSRR
jgi:hypothetical protein